MANRYKTALEIQQGACNPTAIAHAIVNAGREVIQEQGTPTKDAAIRLMVHQLAYVCGISEIDHDLSCYGALRDECESKSA